MGAQKHKARFSRRTGLRGLEGGERKPVGLRLATFGTWPELPDRPAETLRALLDSEGGMDRCRMAFAAAYVELIDALVSAEFGAILRHAWDRRNSWSGHDGLATDSIPPRAATTWAGAPFSWPRLASAPSLTATEPADLRSTPRTWPRAPTDK